MEKVTLNARLRKNLAKSANNELRRLGKVPGIYYSKKDAPVAIEVANNDLTPLVFTGEAHVVALDIEGGSKHDCILKDVQFDPVTDRIVHFDLLGLVAGAKISVEVPVHFTGTSAGVRAGGIIQEFIHKLNISVNSDNIPEFINIDVSDLKMGRSIHVRDLNIEGVTFNHPADTVLVAVTPPRGEATAAEGTEERTEPEVITKGKDKEE